MSRRTVAAVVLLTVVGAALRFATLDRQSFWLDELVTVSLLDRGFGDMLAEIRAGEATPYLYYVLAWPWSRVAGLGEIGLRSFSAIVGTAAIPVAYGAGSAFVSRRVGLIAAALVAVHPLLVWYSQEARSYSLLVLLGAGTVLFLGRALRDGPQRSALVGWALVSSLAIATHYFAILIVLAEAAWLVARSHPRRSAVVASLVPALAFVAHMPLLLAQRGNGETVGETSLLSRIAGVPKALVVGYSFSAEVAGTLLAAALVVLGLALLALRTPLELRRGALVAGSLALVYVLPLGLALAGSDYLTARNLVLAVVPGAVCVATGYAANRLGLAAGAALCALLLTITLSVSLDERYGRTDWRGAADQLQPIGVGRAIVVTPYVSRSLWSPYLPRLEEPSGENVTVEEISVVGLATEGGFSVGPVEPPDVEPRPLPSGFTLVSVERTPTFTHVRYRAPRPTEVSTTTLAALRLAEQQPGLLLQGVGAP